MIGSQDAKPKFKPHPTRKNSVRKFGYDLTNLLGSQSFMAPTNRISDLHKPRFRNRNSKDQKIQSRGVLLHDGRQEANSLPMKLKAYSAPDENQKPVIEPLQDHIDDIVSYLIHQSVVSTAQSNYLEWQTQITAQMRQILVSWLIKVHTLFGLRQETLFLSVNLLDRYCYIRNIVSKQKYQLLGITCLFIASKYQEISFPKMGRYLETCIGLYDVSEMISMEGQVLIAIKFEIEKTVIMTRHLMLARIEYEYANMQDPINAGTDELESSEMSIEKLGNQNYQSADLSVPIVENKQEQKKQLKSLCDYILSLTLLEEDFCRMKPNYASAVILYMGIKLRNHLLGESDPNKVCSLSFGSNKVMEKYELNKQIFGDYFKRLLGLYHCRGHSKFGELNRKFQVSFDNGKV